MTTPEASSETARNPSAQGRVAASDGERTTALRAGVLPVPSPGRGEAQIRFAGVARLGAQGWRLLLAAALIGWVLSGCQDPAQPLTKGESPAGTPPEVPFALKVDQPGVLYTFVAEDGSFHLAEKLDEVPTAARSQVRVVVDGQPPGTPTHVFVADLGQARPGDQVPLVALGRAAWEAHGLKYRRDKVAPHERKEDGPTGDVQAVIYGASWCGPCHQAEEYLKKKGLAVVKKDIEKDPAAAGEMRAKLQKAGLGGSSIPILDVGGTILVGFSPRAIDAALRHANP